MLELLTGAKCLIWSMEKGRVSNGEILGWARGTRRHLDLPLLIRGNSTWFLLQAECSRTHLCQACADKFKSFLVWHNLFHFSSTKVYRFGLIWGRGPYSQGWIDFGASLFWITGSGFATEASYKNHLRLFPFMVWKQMTVVESSL